MILALYKKEIVFFIVFTNVKKDASLQLVGQW
jgi:hypothetical protein